MTQRWISAKGPDAATAASAAVAVHGGRVVRVVPSERSGFWNVQLTAAREVTETVPEAAEVRALADVESVESDSVPHARSTQPSEPPPRRSDANRKAARRRAWGQRIAVGILVLLAFAVALQQRHVADDWKVRAEVLEAELEDQKDNVVTLQEALERSEAAVAELEDDVERLAADLAEQDDDTALRRADE